MSEEFVKGDGLELALASFELTHRGIILLTPMVALTNAANSKLLTEAREYGRHLAEMLAASHFSTEEKQARMALRGKTHMVPDRLENVIKAAR